MPVPERRHIGGRDAKHDEDQGATISLGRSSGEFRRFLHWPLRCDHREGGSSCLVILDVLKLRERQRQYLQMQSGRV